MYKNKQEFDILLWYFDLMSFALQQTNKPYDQKIATTLQVRKKKLMLKRANIMKNWEGEIQVEIWMNESMNERI